MTKNKNKVDWFGMKKNKKNKVSSLLFAIPKKKTKSSSVLFPGLNLNPRKTEPASFMKPVRMTPTLFKKNRAKNFKTSEELLYSKKRLSLFGDRDLDGSPNKFDCNPWRVDRDGPVSYLKGVLSRRKEAKRLKTKSASEIAEEPEQYVVQKAIIEKGKRAGAKRIERETRALMKAEGIKMSKEKLRKAIDEAQKMEEKTTQAKEKIKEREQFKEGGRYYGKLGKIRLKEKRIEEKIEKGETPTSKELEEIEKAKEGYKETHPLAALAAGEIPSAKAIKTSVRGAEWGKEASSFGKRMSGMAAGVLGAFLPPETLSTKPTKSIRSRGQAGRPKGTFSHFIPGQGLVDVYTYRKWARQQRAMARLKGQLPEQQITAQLQEEQPVMQETEEQAVYTGEQLPQMESLEPAKAGLNDMGNYDYSRYNAPSVYDNSNLSPDQARDMQIRSQAYQKVMLNQQYDKLSGQMLRFKDMKEVAQYNAQKNDIILNAPSFLKGELIGTGQHGFTYTPPEQNILNAPNISMGGLRNVGQAGDIPAVKLSEKPIPNPYGDQYTEINPITGQSVLRTRKSEKWSTGEAY